MRICALYDVNNCLGLGSVSRDVLALTMEHWTLRSGADANCLSTKLCDICACFGAKSVCGETCSYLPFSLNELGCMKKARSKVVV